MRYENLILTRSQFRSPRSAAIAGIIFSILTTASMVAFYPISRLAPAEISDGWLDRWAATSKFGISLVPFAGIAFLWFTGVIRDRLGAKEDQFFSTVFLGSGILFVAMNFIWAATVGAILSTRELAVNLQVSKGVYIFGLALTKEVVGNFALRIAGVYMLSIATIWSRSGTAPRWLAIVTYIVAVGFLFFAGSVRETRFIFPAWVFVVSIHTLIVNYRQLHEPKNEITTTN